MNILVIDVGTSSMRGILFSHEGKLLAEKQTLYSVSYLENSWVEQEASDWENALYGIIKTVAGVAEKKQWGIDAVTITSQRSSVIPVDQNIHPLCNAIMWQDKRTNEICERFSPLNDKVFSLCGSRINPVFSASKMTWISLTGCPEGIPVITAGGDQQCGAIGQGVVKKGILSVTAGTGGFLITATDKVPEHLEPYKIYYHHRRGFEDCFEAPQNIPFRSCL